jgi:hypothetical protein
MCRFLAEWAGYGVSRDVAGVLLLGNQEAVSAVFRVGERPWVALLGGEGGRAEAMAVSRDVVVVDVREGP